MSYEQFFGFTEAPFSLAPNPRFLFESASHAAALAQVAYAIERREPLVVVTGEIGTGKTLLCRTVIQRLERTTFVSVIGDPLLERDDLLKQLLQDFGVISKDRTRLSPTSRHDLVHALHEFLASLISIQAHAVVIIDEAQHVQPEVLEEIRLLSNLGDARGTMLQIVLVGQTDMEPLLARPELRQIQQRVSRRFRLEPLTSSELQQYIKHRLAVASGVANPFEMSGATELEREMAEWDLGAAADRSVVFTSDALQEIWKLSAGVPRVVNIVCDRALEAAYERQSRTIDAGLVQTAAAALGLGPPPATRKDVAPAGESVPVAFAEAADPTTSGKAPRRVVLIAAVLLTAAALWFGVYALTSSTPEPPETQPVTTSAPPEAAKPTEPVPPPPAPVPDPAPAPPAAAAATPTPQSTGERFEIVVASFRTNSRATSVAAEVTALGLPVRRRVANGWQQVLAGPFATRKEADDAQQRLVRAGITGTQITKAEV